MIPLFTKRRSDLFAAYYRKGGCDAFQWKRMYHSQIGQHDDHGSFQRSRIEQVKNLLHSLDYTIVIRNVDDPTPVIFMPRDVLDPIHLEDKPHDPGWFFIAA